MTDGDSTIPDRVKEFFDAYERALLARDSHAIAAMYSVPALIVFPNNLIPVSSTGQTQEFFESAFEQYEGVDHVDRKTSITAEAPGSVWADVSWHFISRESERFCYQLVDGTEGYRIAVLTPLQ